MTISVVGNAIFAAEDAMKHLFEGLDPEFMLFEGLTIKQLVDSSNDFRDPNKNYREMDVQGNPIWNVDAKNKEITVSYKVKSLRKGSEKDSDDTHTPEVRFMGVGIQEVDPKEQRKTSRSKYKNMIPMYLPKDPNFDIDAWMETAEDKYDTPEAMDKALAALTTLWYIDPLTSKTEIAVRCTCEDFHWTFLRANRDKGAYFGKPLKSFDTKGTGQPRNPDNAPGYCAHLRFVLEAVSTAELLWQARSVKLAGSKSHKVDSDDIGVWADAAGY